MIMIALSDGNRTYCQGLKTMLEQVEDFRVAIIPPESICSAIANYTAAGILLVDEDLYQTCSDSAGKKERITPPPKTILLTMDRDELNSPFNGYEVLYKGSGKKEFEARIRKLARTGGSQ